MENGIELERLSNRTHISNP